MSSLTSDRHTLRSVTPVIYVAITHTAKTDIEDTQTVAGGPWGISGTIRRNGDLKTSIFCHFCFCLLFPGKHILVIYWTGYEPRYNTILHEKRWRRGKKRENSMMHEKWELKEKEKFILSLCLHSDWDCCVNRAFCFDKFWRLLVRLICSACHSSTQVRACTDNNCGVHFKAKVEFATSRMFSSDYAFIYEFHTMFNNTTRRASFEYIFQYR